MRFFEKSLIVSLLIVLMAIPIKTIKAQTSALQLSPFLIQRDLKRGDNFNTEIKITNSGKKTKYLSLSLRNFLPSGNDGSTQILDENQKTPTGLVDWIKISNQPEYLLEPEQSTVVNFSVNVPAEAEAGSHFGALLFTLEDQLVEPGQSMVRQQAGALIIVDVDRSFEFGLINSFLLTRLGNERNRLQFQTIFKNTGLSSLQPKGKIEIYNWQGNLVSVAAVNQDANIVLPNSQRLFTSATGGNFGGPYSAKLTVWYGSKKLEAKASQFFLVWPPLDVILRGSVYLVLIVLILWQTIKRYNAWLRKKYT